MSKTKKKISPTAWHEHFQGNKDYVSVQEATSLKEFYESPYKTIHFEGFMRMFATDDAYLDAFQKYAHEDEDFEAFQIRMAIAEALDVDSYGDDYRKPRWRPLALSTEIVDYKPNLTIVGEA